MLPNIPVWMQQKQTILATIGAKVQTKQPLFLIVHMKKASLFDMNYIYVTHFWHWLIALLGTAPLASSQEFIHILSFDLSIQIRPRTHRARELYTQHMLLSPITTHIFIGFFLSSASRRNRGHIHTLVLLFTQRTPQIKPNNSNNQPTKLNCTHTIRPYKCYRKSIKAYKREIERDKWKWMR